MLPGGSRCDLYDPAKVSRVRSVHFLYTDPARLTTAGTGSTVASLDDLDRDPRCAIVPGGVFSCVLYSVPVMMLTSPWVCHVTAANRFVLAV